MTGTISTNGVEFALNGLKAFIDKFVNEKPRKMFVDMVWDRFLYKMARHDHYVTIKKINKAEKTVHCVIHDVCCEEIFRLWLKEYLLRKHQIVVGVGDLRYVPTHGCFKLSICFPEAYTHYDDGRWTINWEFIKQQKNILMNLSDSFLSGIIICENPDVLMVQSLRYRVLGDIFTITEKILDNCREFGLQVFCPYAEIQTIWG